MGDVVCKCWVCVILLVEGRELLMLMDELLLVDCGLFGLLVMNLFVVW